MIADSNLHIEVAGRIATLYVVGALPRIPATLVAFCNGLPASVEVLSVNLDGVKEVGTEELRIIDEMRSHWLNTRSGPLRVAFSLSTRNPGVIARGSTGAWRLAQRSP